jgi:hypothetical protein
MLEDPGVSGMVINSRDITERKKAERERARLLIRERAARAEAETTQQHLKVIWITSPKACWWLIHEGT